MMSATGITRAGIRIALPAWVTLLLLSSCHRHPVFPETGSIRFGIVHQVDQQELFADSIVYMNAAGNQYSVSKLEYYVSGITLTGDGIDSYTDGKVHYVNAFRSSTCQWVMENIPVGDYNKISFHIGLVPDSNKTGGLPGNMENINMAWPEPMGGGYHFLKLEGHFLDSANAVAGYALHVGTNACLGSVYLDTTLTVRFQNQRLDLVMNVNEWFGNPTRLDLNQVNYTMGDQVRMLELINNGTNAFAFK
ncbi:MAG: hypothetical protein H6585_03060 [Flavobacteriales bacterium]|nr:hypothetical protein [Flavobacteriales bacterium]MCB9447307.1 hypothetical protein [Flavobacteriales bacterium]